MLDYEESEEFCRKWGGHLLILFDESEYKQLLAHNKTVWFDIDAEMSFFDVNIVDGKGCKEFLPSKK